MPETATYIYCLVERTRRPAWTPVPRGLPGASAPALIDLATGFWAVAADVPLDRYGPDRLERSLQDINWVADIALAHESVVEHFASRADTTVVPMKLFTMFSSRDRAAADLRARHREIAPVLKRIRGCQEWGVRVVRRQMKPSSIVSGRANSSGTAFLTAKKRARDEAREGLLKAATAAERVFTTLSRLARASQRREAPENATTPPLVEAAFLVPSAKRARFRAAVGKSASACRKAGVDLVLTGPWPAYNFVQRSSERA